MSDKGLIQMMHMRKKELTRELKAVDAFLEAANVQPNTTNGVGAGRSHTNLGSVIPLMKKKYQGMTTNRKRVIFALEGNFKRKFFTSSELIDEICKENPTQQEWKRVRSTIGAVLSTNPDIVQAQYPGTKGGKLENLIYKK